MKNRTFFLILVIYVPTVLWSILGYLVYLSTIQEYPFLNNAGFLEVLFKGDLFARFLALLSSYLLAIVIGLIFYYEIKTWEKKKI
jgi:hypothetical protein